MSELFAVEKTGNGKTNIPLFATQYDELQIQINN